jgi:beta-lactamase class A
MQQRRRTFLAQAAAAVALNGSQAALGQAAGPGYRGGRNCSALEQQILELFSDLPDRKAVKIWAPATHGGPELLVELNAGQQMFMASTMKAVILCERLRQLDRSQAPSFLLGSKTIETQLAEHELPLDASIWSPGSTIFNPPDLSGFVSERTAMEAMIIHSDNTATDMVLKAATPHAVRRFIRSIGLKKTMIPDSTRVFAAYLLGAPNYKTITWDELISLPPGPLAHPFLNDVQTLASSPDELVSFFSRALEGRFFTHREALVEFRRILLLGDINYLVPFPLGLSVLGKAGYADTAGAHARSIAGAVYFPNRWVYFSMVLNWDAADAEDPETVAAFYGAIRKSILLIRQQLGGASD